MSSSTPGSNASSFAKFAFNIYGTLNNNNTASSSAQGSTNSNASARNPNHYPSSNTNVLNSTVPSGKVHYTSDRDISSISQLSFPIQAHQQSSINHVVIGGKNCLKLLSLNIEQSKIVNELNILEISANSVGSNNFSSTASSIGVSNTPPPHGNSYTTTRNSLSSTSKLSNVNTVKTKYNTIACGLSNGAITIYKIQNNGKSTLAYKLTSHKRTINSLDFLDEASPEDANQFISGSQDGTIKLWDLRASANKPMMSIARGSHSDPIRSCEYSQHSSSRNKITVLSVHDSGALYKYDLRSNHHQIQSGTTSVIPERKWNFHTGPALSLHIHPEKEYVITGGRDHKLCVWNYSESEYRSSPEIVVNSYGPISKVRWCPYQTSGMYDDLPDDLTDDQEDFHIAAKNSLYNYDVACTYLNDDPTMTVYNLKRKYIPKEIITTASSKPFSNFIWGRHPKKTRNLWTITKGNQFASYSLDRDKGVEDFEIDRPLENLRNISMSWSHNMGNLTVVNQEKFEFENFEGDVQPEPGHSLSQQQYLHDREDYDMDLAMAVEGAAYSGGPGSESGSALEDSEKDREPLGSPIGTIPIASNSSPVNFHSAITSSFSSASEKLRGGYNHNNYNEADNASNEIDTNYSDANNNYKLINTPIPHRPPLNRNATQESILSVPSPMNSIHHQQLSHQQMSQSLSLSQQLQQMQQQHIPTKRLLSVSFPSPYLVPISLPIQLNDETIFEKLSFHYLLSIPDGFTLIDVCILNANIAASVNKFRDCQVWRVLAVSLEEEGYSRGTFDNVGENGADDMVNRSDSISTYMYGSGKGDTNSAHRSQSTGIGNTIEGDDTRSISSELDNFVGSFNSNSTSNYGGTDGGATAEDGASSSPEKVTSIRTTKSRVDSFTEEKNSSTGNLMEMINNSRGAFPNNISPIVTRSNSMLAMNSKGSQIFRNTDDGVHIPDPNENENAIIDDDDESGGITIEAKSTNDGGVDSHSKRSADLTELKKHASLPTLPQAKVPDTPTQEESISIATSPPIKISPHPTNRRTGGDSTSLSSRTPTFSKNLPRPSFGTGKRPEDLDDENMNILSAAGYGASFSSSGKSIASSPTFFSHLPHASSHTHHNSHSHNQQAPTTVAPPPLVHSMSHHGSFSTRRSSNFSIGRSGPISTGGKASTSITSFPKEESLNRVQEQAEDDALNNSLSISASGGGSVPSQLTKAIHREEVRIKDDLLKPRTPSLTEPWKTKGLLEEALKYAVLQGDIITCSTFAILFYNSILKSKDCSITRENCLEWLALYIEILRRKQLFVTAMKVLNEAPDELKADLNRICGNEVGLRFYCSWCQKLLVNEESKVKFTLKAQQNSQHSPEFLEDGNFGYWYCDECSKRQTGCVYCNEPCKGLSVVVSLRCGHRGHFGCLKEWFVDGENTECPGGCGITII